MKGFTASNFLSNIVKLKLHTPALVDRIANLIIDHKWNFSATQTSFIIWSLAKSNSKNDRYLDYAAKNLVLIVNYMKSNWNINSSFL